MQEEVIEELHDPDMEGKAFLLDQHLELRNRMKKIVSQVLEITSLTPLEVTTVFNMLLEEHEDEIVEELKEFEEDLEPPF